MAFSVVISAQNFEGLIIYKNEYKTKNANNNSLNVAMGTKQEYYIKGNNYCSLFNGSYMKKQIYKGIHNKLYNITNNEDVIYYNDCQANTDSVLAHQIILNKDTILGIPCNLLILRCKSSVTFYYFNSNYLKIEADIFKEHHFGNWYFALSLTHSIPLKTIYKNNMFEMTSTIEKFENILLEDVLFALPLKGKILPSNW